MDQEYKPILSEEERAARRAQRAASRRKKQRERRLRLLREKLVQRHAQTLQNILEGRD